MPDTGLGQARPGQIPAMVAVVQFDAFRRSMSIRHGIILADAFDRVWPVSQGLAAGCGQGQLNLKDRHENP